MPVLNYDQSSHHRVLVSESGEQPQTQLYPLIFNNPRLRFRYR